MDLKVLEYIAAIAQEQSITRAAERFYLSQADLSRHLKNVEREMGAPLFTRTSSGVQPTQAGVIFMNDVQAILYMASELNGRLSAMRHQKHNRIRVMTDASFYNRFIRLVMPRFQSLYPNFLLEVTSCNALQARRALLDGTADLGVFFSAVPRAADLEYLTFSSTDTYLVFPKKFDGQTDASGLKQALESGLLIILHPIGTTMRTIQEQQLASHQIFPTQILEGNVHSSMDHIIKGDACGILPTAFLTSNVISQINVGELFFHLHSIIAYSPNTILSTVTQALMQIIMEEFPSS